jgi:DNA-binding GntR family transcriptional regulator
MSTPIKIETQPQYDKAFDALVQALCRGKLRSGTYFTMPALVEELGFPIAAIREATKRAEQQALLKILPKRGITVMDASPAFTRHCMDMRAMMDKEGARRLLARGPAPGLAALRDRHQAMMTRAEQNMTPLLPPEAIDVDLSLHDALANGLENPLLLQCYSENRNRIAVIQHSRPMLQDRIVPAMREHLTIIDALDAGDIQGAVAAIDVHLVQTLRWWGL